MQQFIIHLKTTPSSPKPIHGCTHIRNSLHEIDYKLNTTIHNNTLWLPAEVIYSILQYATTHHGYQPKLSKVYYSIVQYTTAISRSYLQYTMVYYNTIHHGYQLKLSIVYYSIIHHGYQPKLYIQYTIDIL